ncbi:MAG TPA: LuxR C-terminal-related transcriptional regulator [Verrucomicrobiae bacterium]|jgi:DNA-binding NarL/FixJ family response regulator|nr:LuxR C-terminal-related transcriptional regulator [Verrucomicrobiae bacterium]
MPHSRRRFFNSLDVCGHNFPTQAISKADDGDAPMKTSAVRTLLQQCRDLDVLSKRIEDLSPREQQVFDLLATGLVYRNIAVKLNISEETVRSYVKQICKKLDVSNRIEAIANYWQASKLAAISLRSNQLEKD